MVYYINDYEIELALRNQPVNSVRGYAARILFEHKEIVDSNSDGWAHWAPPVRAAKRLIEVVQAAGDTNHEILEKNFKAGVTNLRSFYTRHPQLPIPESLVR